VTINLSGLGIDYGAILPELIVVGTAIVVLFLDLIVPADRRGWLAGVTVVGLLGALAASFPLWGQNRAAFGDTVMADSLAAFFNVLLIVITILTALISPRFLRALDLDFGEYYILLLGATAGMMLLAAATSLMTIFLGIELLSISLYVLSGFARTALRSQEAALKYLLLGGPSTCGRRMSTRVPQRSSRPSCRWRPRRRRSPPSGASSSRPFPRSRAAGISRWR
jgi:NADH-quinone oxidoreductase subunit N